MPSDITDSFLTDSFLAADQREDRVRSRVRLLRRKLEDARDRIDRSLSAQIDRHPWPAVGIAFALGVLAGRLARRSAPRPTPERSFGGAALGALGSLGLHVLRELAVAQLRRTASRWWSEHGGGPLDDVHPFPDP